MLEQRDVVAAGGLQEVGQGRQPVEVARLVDVSDEGEDGGRPPCEVKRCNAERGDEVAEQSGLAGMLFVAG